MRWGSIGGVCSFAFGALALKSPQVLILDRRLAWGSWDKAVLLPSDKRILTGDRRFPHIAWVTSAV